MAHLMEALEQDHRRLQRLLFMLAAEVDRIGSDEQEPDYDRLLTILGYLSDYPEQVHHPAEERAFRHLDYDRLAPDAAAILEEVQEQHHILPGLTARLKRDIEGVLQGVATPLERIREDAREYLRLQLDHIRMENDVVFPLIVADLDDAVLAAIEEDITADPMFDPGAEQRFERLYYDLVEAEHRRSET